MKFLNSKYYDRGETESLEYYSGSDILTTINLVDISINDSTRNFISENIWYLKSIGFSELSCSYIYMTLKGILGM